MAKFKADFGATGYSSLKGQSTFAELSIDDLMAVLRPAAEKLKAHYRAVILKRFKRRTGSLADSIKLDERSLSREYMDSNSAVIFVGPAGKHKNSKRGPRSRKGSPTAKYAKHNRKASATSLSNAELGYLLEYGTPRIDATHWMESANEEIEEELQTEIDENFTQLLKDKGVL